MLDEPTDRPFHLVVRVPTAAADQLALVDRIVAAEKPAAVTAEITVEDVPAERAVGRASVPPPTVVPSAPASPVTAVEEPP